MTSKLLRRACDVSYTRIIRMEQAIVLEAALYVYCQRRRIGDFPRLEAAVDARNVERERHSRLVSAWLKAERAS